MRAYTLNEVDEMRQAVKDIEFCSTAPLPYRGHFSWGGTNDRAIEDKLRTYLLAGIDPQELKKKATEAMDERQRSTDEIRRLEAEGKLI